MLLLRLVLVLILSKLRYKEIKDSSDSTVGSQFIVGY